MGSVNKAILVGNLGKDAELRYTSGGAPVASFSMATTEKFNDREGNKKEQTEWHKINVWGKTAEALQQYLVKGKSVYVEGRIQTRKWTDKNGVDRYSTEIKADQIVLLGGGGGGGGADRGPRPSRDRYESQDGGAADAPHVDAPNDDDIPF